MKAAACLQKPQNRLLRAWQASVFFFRRGEDLSGLAALLGGLEDFECILDLIGCTGEAALVPGGVLPACRSLLACVQSGDVTSLTDLLEFSMIPLLQSWAAGEDA